MSENKLTQMSLKMKMNQTVNTLTKRVLGWKRDKVVLETRFFLCAYAVNDGAQMHSQACPCARQMHMPKFRFRAD